MRLLKKLLLSTFLLLLPSLPAFASNGTSSISVLTIISIRGSCDYTNSFYSREDDYSNLRYRCSVGYSPTILTDSNYFFGQDPLIADGFTHNTIAFSNENAINLLTINY